MGNKNFVNTIIQLGKARSEIKVVNDQHGKPTYTLDVALTLKNMIEKMLPYGIYHLSNEPETTWYDFAKEIVLESKLNCQVIPCTSEEFPQVAYRPRYSPLINTKLPPARDWHLALRDYLKII